jgi:transcriptional regulator with XRE-family HTH domain
MTEPVVNFGEYVKLLRLESKLTLSQAARKMDFKPQKLCDIEAGRRYTKRISMSLVMKLSKVYNVPIAQIIRNTESALSTDKSVSELIQELAPQARLAELLTKSLVDESKTYGPEVETKAVEAYNAIRNMRVLISLMRKRHFNTESESALDTEAP